MSLLTWEEIEKAQLEIKNSIKEIESKLIQEDLEEDTFYNLSNQLEEIQRTVLKFREVQDQFLKDKI